MKSNSPARSEHPHILSRAGSEGGDSLTLNPTGVAALDPFLYQRSRWCSRCAQMETFLEVFECEAGRMGYFVGCGEEEFVPFTRTVEAA